MAPEWKQLLKNSPVRDLINLTVNSFGLAIWCGANYENSLVIDLISMSNSEIITWLKSFGTRTAGINGTLLF